MRRSITFVTLFAMLSGCVSYNHLSSQRRMDDGIAALQAAEKAQRNVIMAIQLQNVGPGVAPSAESLRVALAEDAQHDIDAAKRGLNGGQPQDQISALSRAGLKAWQAGAPGKEQAAEAERLGKAACGNVSPRPQRDCETFKIVRRLNALEIEADKMLVYEAYAQINTFVPGSSVTIATATEEIARQANALAGDVDAENLTLIKNWVERQRAIYICHAVAGYNALSVIRSRSDTLSRKKDATANAREAARLRAENAQKLISQLYIKGDEKTPLYSALFEFNEDFNGALGTSISSAIDGCEKFQIEAG